MFARSLRVVVVVVVVGGAVVVRAALVWQADCSFRRPAGATQAEGVPRRAATRTCARL